MLSENDDFFPRDPLTHKELEEKNHVEEEHIKNEEKERIKNEENEKPAEKDEKDGEELVAAN